MPEIEWSKKWYSFGWIDIGVDYGKSWAYL